ncbi:prolipoprotein diacylglyceryl transferase [Hyphomicrobiales bacterium]|nr:prolipoprotein diacylglyceryl transferase [Hyphomicrobiales bacterium]
MKNFILNINPIAISIGPINIYWYGIAYMAGMILGLYYALRIVSSQKVRCNLDVEKEDIEEIFLWIVLGIILGSRVGYILFYNFAFYLSNPTSIFTLWEGGMSFHGGVTGVIIAIALYSWKNSKPFLEISDIICAVVPIGLFFGRIANFINGELWGKVTSVPWGIVFPNAGEYPRHPSQLYEAGLEGLLLFIVLALIILNKGLRKKGLVSGSFLFIYSSSRIFIEFFREPDQHIGYILPNLTMGIILSIPFLVIGLFLILNSLKNDYS